MLWISLIHDSKGYASDDGSRSMEIKEPSREYAGQLSAGPLEFVMM